MNKLSPVSVDRWSKDHWSLLAYIETLCVDLNEGHEARIGAERLRCNPNRHPGQAGVAQKGIGWNSSYGTRLQGFFDDKGTGTPEDKEKAGLQLTTHDDWDCLNDLVTAGYVRGQKWAKGLVTLTAEGILVAGKIREHKLQGGSFATFKTETPPVLKEVAGITEQQALDLLFYGKTRDEKLEVNAGEGDLSFALGVAFDSLAENTVFDGECSRD